MTPVGLLACLGVLALELAVGSGRELFANARNKNRSIMQDAMAQKQVLPKLGAMP